MSVNEFTSSADYAVLEATYAARNSNGTAAPPDEPDEPIESVPWPAPMADAAYHGVSGEIVEAIAPEVEPAPEGLLLSLLTVAGALMGHHRLAEQGGWHAANLFVVLVGETSVSRKGTTDYVVSETVRLVDPDWTRLLAPGVGSGEGLIHALKARDGEHRVIVKASELGSLLTVMAREGSTLSGVLREAWDGVPLGRQLAREDELVDWHHVALLGHVTPADLRRKLTDTDAANGFGNRFLWPLVRRTKLVPRPPAVAPLVRPFAPRLRDAIEKAQTHGVLTWTPDAAVAWDERYRAQRQGPMGLAGAMTARRDAQIVRLTLIYALLDRALAMDLEHLEAALAVWAYCEASAVWLFGESTGNRHADVALRYLREQGEIDRQTLKQETGLRMAADLDEVEAVLTGLGIARLVTRVRPDGTARRRRVLVLETDETVKTDQRARA